MVKTDASKRGIVGAQISRESLNILGKFPYPVKPKIRGKPTPLLPILSFLPQTFRVQALTEFLRFPIEFSKHTSTSVITAFSKAQSLEDMLKDERFLVQSVSELIDGFGEHLKSIGAVSDAGERQNQLLKTKPSKIGQSFNRDDIKRKPLGRNVRKVQVNGETKFSMRKVSKAAGRIGDALSSICSFLAPIFLIGDLIWGDEAEKR